MLASTAFKMATSKIRLEGEERNTIFLRRIEYPHVAHHTSDLSQNVFVFRSMWDLFIIKHVRAKKPTTIA